MISKLPGEVWKPLKFSGWNELRNLYAVSNKGRIASYKNDFSDAKLLFGSLTTGYKTLNLHRPGNKGTLYIHREMAKIFLKKKTSKQRFVIHRNHNKLDNNIRNLQWATKEEMITHQQRSPAKIAYKNKQSLQTVGLKLNADLVKKIKDTLKDPDRVITIKRLAQKYKVSEMTIYRIKSGENWGRIK